MKKVNFVSMLAAVALVTAVASCSNSDDQLNDQTGTIEQGEPTAMSLTVRAPRAPGTYASSDENATDQEIELKTLNVLIYGQTSTGAYILEQNKDLTMTDFEAVTGKPDTYTLKTTSQIASSTGNKRIYVAMNYPDPSKLPALNQNLLELPKLVYTLTDAKNLSSNGIAMFNTQAKEAKLVALTTDGDIPTDNKVTIEVKRMVAKVTVQESLQRTGSDIISQGGKLTNLQFALGNINKTTYVIQNLVGTPSVVHSTNWDSFTADSFFAISDYALASADYQTVDAKATEVLKLKTAYAPEKTAASYQTDGSNLTYVSVRAQYQPEFFVDATGKTKGDNTEPAQTFWTVVNQDGSILYFESSSDAEGYARLNPGTAPATEYADGLCYFRAYINKGGQADPTISGSTAAKFDVLRNNYYKINITGMKAPGSATDKGIQVAEDTSLTVEVQVQAWHAVSNDYDLQ